MFAMKNIDLNKNEKPQEIVYAIIDPNLLQILVVSIWPHGHSDDINIEYRVKNDKF